MAPLSAAFSAFTRAALTSASDAVLGSAKDVGDVVGNVDTPSRLNDLASVSALILACSGKPILICAHTSRRATFVAALNAASATFKNAVGVLP